MPRTQPRRNVVREGTLERWMMLEMGKVRDALVTQPRPLFELLQQEKPSATTRGGLPHHFDKAMLERFHESLSPLTRRRLRLPVTFYVENGMPTEAYVADEAAAALLHALEEVPASIAFRNDRLWLSHAKAIMLLQRWKGAFQVAYL